MSLEEKPKRHSWKVRFRDAFGNPIQLKCERCGRIAKPSDARRGIGACKNE